MPTVRGTYGYWWESKRAVEVAQDQFAVKQTTCCCKAPAGTRRACADATGNKTPCRCYCYKRTF